MGFEFVRGYLRFASDLSGIAQARAVRVAQGLLSLPAAGIVNGGKMAVQAGVLAEELLTSAAANRSNFTTLVRSELDVAITRMGLVSVQQLEEAQAEAARLRSEVARLRSASSKAPTALRATKKAAPPRPTKESASKSPSSGASSRKTRTARTASRSAVTTRQAQ